MSYEIIFYKLKFPGNFTGISNILFKLKYF
jgi:hypothetical protein